MVKGSIETQRGIEIITEEIRTQKKFMFLKQTTETVLSNNLFPRRRKFYKRKDARKVGRGFCIYRHNVEAYAGVRGLIPAVASSQERDREIRTL